MNYRLIVDIEPNSVALGLTIGNASKLEYVDRQYVSYGKKPSMKQMQAKLSALIRQMMPNLLSSQIKDSKIESILCIHSCAWSIAETHSIDLHFPKPVKVDESVIINSVHDNRKDGRGQAKDRNLELVYHQIQKIKLNGYFADEPWGKVAENVTCDLIEGYIDSSMRHFYEDEFLRYCHTLTHVPEAFVVINATRILMPELPPSLIIHIGGETSEIIYGDNKVLIASASVPAGISSLVRATAQFVHGDEALAFSHISMSAKGNRIPTKKEQLVINQSIDDWRNEFVKGVQIACGTHVPEHIYYFSALHSMSIAAHMLNGEKMNTWSGTKHDVVRLFGKKTFQHDFMIAAAAQYVVQ